MSKTFIDDDRLEIGDFEVMNDKEDIPHYFFHFLPYRIVITQGNSVSVKLYSRNDDEWQIEQATYVTCMRLALVMANKWYKELADYSKQMQDIKDKNGWDEEVAHHLADNLLCEILLKCGYKEVVEIFRSIKKWYA